MWFLAAAGLVMILTGLGAYYATERLSLFSVGNLVLGPILLLVAAGAQARQIRGFSGSRARRIALRWTVIGAAGIAVLVALNLAAADWTTKLDLTRERSYTLSEQTLAICRGLETLPADSAPELFFFEDAKLAREVAPLVRAYRAACPRVRIRDVRPEDAPPCAREIVDLIEATVVARQGERCEPVGFPSEENITNALIRLRREEALRAYFLLGHGEADLADEGDDGFAGLAAVLRAEGIEARGWIGPAQARVPSDASLVIVAAPERRLLPPELEALGGYVASGGRLLVLLEPGANSGLESLLERWGFAVPAGVLVDQASSPLLEDPPPISLLANRFEPFHAITRSMSVRSMVLIPGARAVLPARRPQPEDELRPLVYTSRRAWLETDTGAALAGGAIRPDPQELQGREIPFAAAGRYPRAGGEARVVVIGDRDFVSNRLLGSLYNRDLLMNAVLWLAEDEQQIAIRSKIWTPDHHPVTIQQTLSYFYFFAFALPEVLLLMGIAAWYRQQS